MKFDAVIGNPPYSGKIVDSSGKEKDINLWARLSFEGFDLVKQGGAFAFIVPDTWRTLTNDYEGRSLLRDVMHQHNTVVLNLNEAEKWFNVGSTISYMVIEKKAYTGRTKIITTQGTFHTDLTQLPMIPVDTSKLGLHIFTKVWAKRTEGWDFVVRRSKENLSIEYGEEGAAFPIKTFNDHSGRVRWADRKGLDHDEPKVMVSYQARYVAQGDEGYITPSPYAYRQILPRKHVRSAAVLLNSSLYRFIVESNKSNQYYEKALLNQLPKLDLDHVWTDAAVFANFGISAAEQQYVTDFIANLDAPKRRIGKKHYKSND